MLQPRRHAMLYKEVTYRYVGKEFSMKFHVNSSCIGCGMCASTCPEVFHITDDNVAQAGDDTVPAELEAVALEARNSCPVSAIETV